MNYQAIKQMVLSGEEPSAEQFAAAIRDQVNAVATYANSTAKHAAILLAAREHPFPVPEDQQGRVIRRAVQFDHELQRLTRLYYWREVAAMAPRVAGSQA